MLRICTSSEERCAHFGDIYCYASDDCEADLEAKRADVILARGEPGNDSADVTRRHFVTLATLRPTFAVAVVETNRNAFPRSIDELYRRSSCHSVFGDVSGWAAPLAAIRRRGLLGDEQSSPMRGGNETTHYHTLANHDQLVPNDIEAALAFFGRDICAPGRARHASAAFVNYQDGICDGCAGDCSADATREPYFGDEGALRCLSAGGDVAFLDSAALLSPSLPPSTATTNLPSPSLYKGLADRLSSSHALLCSDGGYLELPPASNADERQAAIEACNLGAVPSESLVVLAGSASGRQWMWRRHLVTVAEHFLATERINSATRLFWEDVSFTNSSVGKEIDPYDQYRHVMHDLVAVPYTIGVSERLSRKCSLPACARMTELGSVSK